MAWYEARGSQQGGGPLSAPTTLTNTQEGGRLRTGTCFWSLC